MNTVKNLEQELRSQIHSIKTHLQQLNVEPQTEEILASKAQCSEALLALESALTGFRHLELGHTDPEVSTAETTTWSPASGPKITAESPPVDETDLFSLEKGGGIRLLGSNSGSFAIDSLCEVPVECQNGSTVRVLGRIEKLFGGGQGMGATPEEPTAIVSHAAPTAASLVRCRFIRSPQQCRFAERCRFHHGLSVPATSIRPLHWRVETDVEKGARVMAKDSGGLWRSATVTGLDTRNGELHFLVNNGVKGSPESRVVTSLEILPLVDETPTSTASQPETSKQLDEIPTQLESFKDLDSDDDEFDAERVLVADSSFGGFGDWTKYSKGFGIKMLMKMGYKLGEPLGRSDRPATLGPALKEPLPIRVLPPRKSLDFDKNKRARKRLKGSDGAQWHRSGEGEATKCESHAWMGLMDRLISNTNAPPQKASEKAKKEMQAIKSLKECEPELRKRLAGIHDKILQANRALDQEEKNCSRHSGDDPSCNPSLHSEYKVRCNVHRERLKRLEEEKKVVEDKLHGKRMRIKNKVF